MARTRANVRCLRTAVLFPFCPLSLEKRQGLEARMDRRMSFVALLFLLAPTLFAQGRAPATAPAQGAAAPAAGSARLPVRRVVLYKTGVGSASRDRLDDGPSRRGPAGAEHADREFHI